METFHDMAPRKSAFALVVSDTTVLLALRDGRRRPGKRPPTAEREGASPAPVGRRPVEPDASRGACPARWRLREVIPPSRARRSNPPVLSNFKSAAGVLAAIEHGRPRNTSRGRELLKCEWFGLLEAVLDEEGGKTSTLETTETFSNPPTGFVVRERSGLVQREPPPGAPEQATAGTGEAIPG